jgi:PAS domain S-box-containing protein
MKDIRAQSVDREPEDQGVESIGLDDLSKLAQFSLDQAVDPILWVNAGGKFIYANQAACLSLEYSLDEMRTMTVHDIDPLFPKERWPSHWEEIRQKRSFVFESIHRTKSGKTFPVEITVNCLTLGDKEYNCVFARNITERKQIEEQLSHFFAIVSSSHDAILGLTIDGVIISWNAAAERLFGYTAEEAIGLSISFLWPADKVAEGRSLLDKARHGYMVDQYETIRQRKDGSPLNVSITLSPCKDDTGSFVGYSAIVRDITERKQAEIVLRESEERYRSLVDNISMGITLMDCHYRIVTINRVHADMIGRPVEHCIGQECFRVFEKREAVCPHCPGTRAMATGMPAEVEAMGVRDNGTTYPARVQAFPLFGSDMTINGFIEVVEDITDRKHTEQELTNAKLAAEASERAKGEFLANMSHEIRTPMTAILGFADILLGSSSPKEIAEAAQIIKRNGDNLLTIINDILDLSRIESGKQQTEELACSPDQIVADVISTMKVSADAKGLFLRYEIADNVPDSIHTDPMRLRQILVNLVGNAIKFTEVGGVMVNMQLETDASNEPKLRFDVVDTGIGLSKENIGKVFQPFSQADSSTSRRFGGTGLGLAISQRLAKILGGDIVVSSILERGSTFTLTIATGPLHRQDQLRPPFKTAKVRSQGSSCDIKLSGRILLAEDGPDNQRLIRHILQKAGAEVTVADNGQVAIELTLAAQRSGRPFDVVLMDIQMPIMDGYEATRQLRRAGYTGVVVALTAHAMTEDRQKCLNAGCNEYTTKPIDRTDLLRIMEKYVVRPDSRP